MLNGKLSLRSRHVPGGLYFGPPAWDAPVWPAHDFQSGRPSTQLPTTPAELRDLLHELQLTGQDILTPALATQLETPGIRQLVLNLIPPQPESILPRVLSQFELPRLMAGLNLVRQCVSAGKTCLAVPRGESELRYLWRQAAKAHRLRVHPLINRYPLGHPSILLRALLGLKLEPGASPAALGVILLDPMTCWLLGCWIEFGTQPSWRPVEIFTHNAMPRVVAANLGHTLAQVLTASGIAYQDRQCIVNGMMAGTLVDPESTRLEAWIRMISIRPNPRTEEAVDCIRCGWCVSACPVGLNPAGLMAQARVIDGLPAIAARESSACIDCGLCSYVCPSRLPLAVTIHSLKAGVRPANSSGGGRDG